MKEKFEPWEPRADRQRIVNRCIAVCTRYMSDGYTLTLRQLYYQLVATAVIPNSGKSYKALGQTVSRARLAGLIDWSSIEDRSRLLRSPLQFSSVEHLMEVALRSFRLDRWKNQPYYLEVWCEKDALSGVLEPICHDEHVHFMATKGYTSQSAMYDAAKRFIKAEKHGQNSVLLYFGDLDPSGEDMVRDIRDRLEDFGADVEVRKLALTIEQVNQYDPPPNPAKQTDTRAEAYIAQYGDESWELDALSPPVLVNLLEDAIADYRDEFDYFKTIKLEAILKHKLRKATNGLVEVKPKRAPPTDQLSLFQEE